MSCEVYGDYNGDLVIQCRYCFAIMPGIELGVWADRMLVILPEFMSEHEHCDKEQASERVAAPVPITFSQLRGYLPSITGGKSIREHLDEIWSGDK